jgi:hypothetical protein
MLKNQNGTPLNNSTFDPSASVIRGEQQAVKTIDWTQPVYVLQTKGELGDAQVRVIAHGVRRFPDDYPSYTTIVAVTGRSHDILVAVDPGTGTGRSLRNGVKFSFANREEPKADQCFVNVYYSGQPGDTVWEAFDTTALANDGNIFGSRDCLVRISVQKQPGGNWTASAEVI